MPPCNTITETSMTARVTDDSILEHQEEKQWISQRGAQQEYYSDPVLKWLFLLVTFLCVNMVFWILVLPASWLIERSTFHREVTLPLMEAKGFFRVVPKIIFTKYEGHSLVHFTHIVPGALWAGIIPFQLHPTWRRNHRQMHRLMGYIFLFVSLAMAVGIFVIIRRKLTFDHSFPDLPPPPHATFVNALFVGLTLWFAGAGIQSVRMARAGRYQVHQKWMLRHVASGIWVAGQRFLVVPFFTVILHFTHPPPGNIPSWLQRAAFEASAYISMVACICLGEYAAHHVTAPSTTTNRQRKLN